MAISISYKDRTVEIKTLRRNGGTPVSFRQGLTSTQVTQAGVTVVTGIASPALRQWDIDGVVTASGATELWNLYLQWEADRVNRVEQSELAIALSDGTAPFQQQTQVVFGGSAGAPKLDRFDDYGRGWSVKLTLEEISSANP